MHFAMRMLKNSLEPIKKSFNNEYEIMPFRITRPISFDFDFEYDPNRNYGLQEYTHGGAWWAYRFGFSENMPKNDVPNISIIANTAGLDIALNAELHPSQKVMFSRIQESTLQFDRLLANHKGLWLKTYLKFEHQPRFYHWILANFMSPREFDGAAILGLRREHEKVFAEERERRICNIRDRNKELSEQQIKHLETHTKKLNLAIRLVEPFQKEADFWTFPFDGQVKAIVASVQRMKPIVDFFVKTERAI
jgi:hypothetical protein